MKNFNFTWYKNEKYHKITRHNTISAADANSALGLFKRNFGNLDKNTIIAIQEVDKQGNAVGDPIIPGQAIKTEATATDKTEKIKKLIDN